MRCSNTEDNTRTTRPPRLVALTGNRLLFHDGLPTAALSGGEIRFFGELDPATEWQARKALLQGPARPIDAGANETANGTLARWSCPARV